MTSEIECLLADSFIQRYYSLGLNAFKRIVVYFGKLLIHFLGTGKQSLR